MSGYNFQKELETSIFKSDEKLDKKELLIDIFKAYVAKLFELVLNKSKSKDRIEFEALVQIKRNLISEFRQASLAEHQISVKQYEDLFDETVKEIVDFAGNMHNGADSVSCDQTLDINKDAYLNEFKKTDSGIFLKNN